MGKYFGHAKSFRPKIVDLSFPPLRSFYNYSIQFIAPQIVHILIKGFYLLLDAVLESVPSLVSRM